LCLLSIVVKPDEPMRLIGAGLGRTGTMSTKAALERLGLKAYHFLEIFKSSQHCDLWNEQAPKLKMRETKNEGAQAIMDALSKDGYNATLDFPICFLYDDFMKRYPDARVLLTVRSNADKWATSMLNAVIPMHQIKVDKRMPWKWIPPFSQIAKMNEWMPTPKGTMEVDPITGTFNKTSLTFLYDMWLKNVTETVPPEKLLVFQAKEGYEPLCKFLEGLSPITDKNCKEVLESGENFPNVNSTTNMNLVLYLLLLGCWVFEYGPYIIPLLLAYKYVSRQKKEGTKLVDSFWMFF